jgi:diaminopimelate dehydrogenase
MSDVVRVAIVGYGNLGKGVESEISKNKDMKLVAIFTRRDPESVKTMSDVPVVSIKDMEKWNRDIDVCIMCGGSATDLPVQVPEVAKFFNTVDSFDTHAKIPEHFANVNKVDIENKHVSIISGGWDPGLFSLNRVYAESILPNGKTYTFWGEGVSQGHSDAVRRIAGVKDARQYTIPIDEAMERVRDGEQPELSTGEKHKREVFVVAEDGVTYEDQKRIVAEIVSMPNYFDEYTTEVQFISEEKMKAEHSKLPHGGFVIHSGETGDGNKQLIEYSLKLDSNPEFTASVLICLARACARFVKNNDFGCKTILDIPPKYFSAKEDSELRSTLL